MMVARVDDGSVRIQTKKSYNGGLFIADFFAMPHGCAVWPAYWTVSSSATWPDGGEIDIIGACSHTPTPASRRSLTST